MSTDVFSMDIKNPQAAFKLPATGRFIMKKKISIAVALVMLAIPAFPQQTVNSAKPENTPAIKLNIQEVIIGIVNRNLDVQKAVIDYGDAGTDLEKFLGQYDTFAYGKLFSSYQQTSPKDPSVGGTKAYQSEQTGVEAGVQKSFSTGTTFMAGVNSAHQNVTPDKGASELQAYASSVNIGLSQELMKNAFGANNRRSEKSLEKASEIKQRAARQIIANTVLSSFSAYWDFIYAEKTMQTAEIAYKNTQDIRNLVQRKSAVGISEREELLDWEGRVLLAKNSYDGAQLGYTNARLAILRALDLDRNLKVELAMDLVMTPPAIKFEEAISDAFKKRTDLANLRTALEVSEMSYSNAKGNALPSVKASAGLGYSDYDPDTVSGSFNEFNKQWNVSLSISKPLEGTSDGAEVAAAKKAVHKRKIEVKQLEDGIRDEIQVRIAQCEATYKIFKQTAQSSEYARGYYEGVYRKFSQGRYETTQLKLAFDNYISLRTNALKTLINYNVALLQLDIARNTVFERYSIDIDKLVAKTTK